MTFSRVHLWTCFFFFFNKFFLFENCDFSSRSTRHKLEITCYQFWLSLRSTSVKVSLVSHFFLAILSGVAVRAAKVKFSWKFSGTLSEPENRFFHGFLGVLTCTCKQMYRDIRKSKCRHCCSSQLNTVRIPTRRKWQSLFRRLPYCTFQGKLARHDIPLSASSTEHFNLFNLLKVKCLTDKGEVQCRTFESHGRDMTAMKRGQSRCNRLNRTTGAHWTA